MRLRALIAWIAFAVLAFLCIYAPEQQNAGLPIIHSALKDYPRDHMLFSPCVGGQFAPRPKRSIA